MIQGLTEAPSAAGTPQEAVYQRLNARLAILGVLAGHDPDATPGDAAPVLEALGLLPGQTIDAPANLSSGWFDPACGGLSSRTVLGRTA